MRYCNLKFGYNKAFVKSTALQNCAGNKKHTLPIKTTPNLMEHKMCLATCIIIMTKPHLKQSVYFFTNTVKVGAV